MSEKGRQKKNGKSSRAKKDGRLREVEARREGWIVVTVRDCREKKNRIKGGRRGVKKGRENRQVDPGRMEKYASVERERKERIR